jgi:thiosulfate/3-mercaptopyruvate sulfurtransferase
MSARFRFAFLLVGIASCRPQPVWAQWPPWLAKDEPPPVYPDVLVDADSLVREGVVVLDARDADRWARGHVPGAVSFPHSENDAAEVGSALATRGVSGRERIVCVGEREDLVEVARLFWLLETAGCPEVRILDGGLEAWSASGGALVTSHSERPAVRWSVTPEESRRATVDFVRERFGRPDPGRPNVEILDARPEMEWSGIGDLDGGHIPHSLPIDVDAFIQADGRFAPKESTRAIVDRIGPRLATTVELSSEFITTDDGVSAAGALVYLALRIAAIERVRYFPGGFAEWKASDLPRVRVAAVEEVRSRLAKSATGGRGVVLVDVRGAADFAAGHIPDALLISPVGFADSLGVVLERERPMLDRGRTTFIAYCYGKECVRSRNAATTAAQQGFVDSIWFRGGLPEWIAAGGEIVRER